MDFLNPSPELKGFDLCIDKGTFDAISLNPEDREIAKLQYMSSLRAVLKSQGHFIITSCNWTKEQLLQIFSPGTEAKVNLKEEQLDICHKKKQKHYPLSFEKK